MGSVNRKRITNIFDVPQDVLVDFIGEGFRYDTEERSWKVDIGDCLRIHEGKIALDREIDEEKTITMTQCVDIQMELQGRKLVLVKFFADYKLFKNRHGLLLSIEKIGDTRSEVQELLFTDLSYTGNLIKPSRENSDEYPAFYK